MSKPDNPALFALEIKNGCVSHSTTISLRDLFAAFALAGQLAEGDTVDPAKWAYRYADQMLAEREKTE